MSARNRLLVLLAVSSILVLGAGNIAAGSYAYLRFDGRMTFPEMTGLGSAAHGVLTPGRVAVQLFIRARHDWTAKRHGSDDFLQRYSALGTYAVVLLGSIASYTATLYGVVVISKSLSTR